MPSHSQRGCRTPCHSTRWKQIKWMWPSIAPAAAGEQHTVSDVIHAIFFFFFSLARFFLGLQIKISQLVLWEFKFYSKIHNVCYYLDKHKNEAVKCFRIRNCYSESAGWQKWKNVPATSIRCNHVLFLAQKRPSLKRLSICTCQRALW